MFASVLVSFFLFTNYSTDFHKIRWKGGTWAKEEPIRFLW